MRAIETPLLSLFLLFDVRLKSKAMLAFLKRLRLAYWRMDILSKPLF